MNTRERVPYTPSQVKRFEISPDVWSRGRLWAAFKTVQQLREQHSFVVGAILFGSLSKGKILTEESARESDIDLVVCIDTDRLNQSWQQLYKDNSDYAQRLNWWGEIHEETIESAACSYIRNLTIALLSANLPARDKPPESILSQGVATILINLAGIQSLFETFRRGFSSSESQEKFVKDKVTFGSFSYGLALPWGLDIGGGLKPYRKTYLAQLLDLPTGERSLYWKVIVDAIKYYERGVQIPENLAKFYPETLEEAVQLYGLPKNCDPRRRFLQRFKVFLQSFKVGARRQD